MADYRDTFTSEIYVNQSQAADAVEQYTKKLADLQKQLSEIDKSEDGWEKKEKKLQRQIKSTEGTLKGVQTGVENYQKAMDNLDGRSIANLIKLKKQLNSEIKKLVPGTQEYINRTKDLKNVEARINSLAKATQSMSTRMTALFTKYWNMFDTLSRTITGVSMKFRQAAEDAAKLDDAYSDVMKTTGLLQEEVKALDEELMKIDTRTGREQLLMLARDAGKLGITGKENILGFVRAADQIQVALGEDLGEGAIRNLGKIADVLGYTKSMGIEKSLLSIASSINAVGQASTASEAYLVDFTQRLAGVAAQTNISAANIIGFASGLDQSAMKVEMAATSFQKFIMKIYEDPAKFAEYAKVEVEEFTKLLENDANQAIITVLKSLKDKDGFASLVPIFKDMGLDGARAVSVLAAIATNITAVTDAQALANEEFVKANSVTQEYLTKNNNLNAQLEKARKEFKNASIALGQSFNPIMLKSTKGTTYLIKALANYGKEIKAAVISVAALTAVIKLSTIAHTVHNAVVKAGAALKASWIVVTKAASYAINMFRGRTIAATKAYLAMKAAMSTSVFGLLATAVAAVTVAIVHYTKKANEASEATKKMAEIEERMNSEYGESASKVQVLTDIVHNNNLSIDQRRDALKKLQEIVPAYHADLTKEGKLINDNTEALTVYLKNLEKVTRAKILEEEYTQATAAVLKAEQTKRDAEEKRLEALANANGNTTEIKHFTMQSSAGAYSADEITPYGQAVREVTDATNELTEAQEIQAKIRQRIERENGDAFSTRKGEISAEEMEIRALNLEYQNLFKEIRAENRDNPQQALDRIADLQNEQMHKIAEIRKNHAERRTVESQETASTNAALSKVQYDYLKTHYDDLTKKEKAMVDKEYTALSEEESKALAKRYAKLSSADRKASDKRYQEQVKSLEQQQREEQNALNQSYFDKEITAEQHEKALRDITMKYLVEKLELAKANGKDITQIEASILSERMKNRKSDYDEDLKQLEVRQKEEEQSLSLSLSAQEITEKEYHAKSLELKMRYLEEKLKLTLESGQDETAVLQAIFDAQIEAEKAAYDEMKKLKEDAQKVIAGLDPSAARQSELKTELDKLEELHDAKLLSEEQYEKAVKQLRKKYSDEDLQDQLGNIADYIGKANKMMEVASDFVTQLKEMETAQLEAEYQAQLTAAGDNAEEREQIEAEYEQKKLDLQKKYADTEMVINIAKAVAAGALAAIEAFAAAGNPILGAVFAAMIAATTALEVATIVKQRNAIKNTSVSGGGSSSAPSSGTRAITGHAEGGFTENHTTLSTVGEEGVEWIAPHWMVRDNPTTFANLEQYRKTGSHGRSGSVSRGFADGGFTGDVPKGISGGFTTADIEAAVEAAIIKSMAMGAIRAYLVRKDLTELDNQTQRFKDITAR